MSNDENTPDIKLNLSQAPSANGPRVHWSISPLNKGSNSITIAESGSIDSSSEYLKLKDMNLALGLKEHAQRPEGLDDQEPTHRHKLPKSIKGLLKSKSASCSPLAAKSNPNTPRHYSKLDRSYVSPSTSKTFFATTEPSSSSQPNSNNSPFKPSMVNDQFQIDIEDTVAGIGSSFFSDLELNPAVDTSFFSETEIDNNILPTLQYHEIDLEGFDLFDTINEPLDPVPTIKIFQKPSNGPIHKRLFVHQIQRVDNNSVRLTAKDHLSKSDIQLKVSGDWIRALPVGLDTFFVHVILENHNWSIDDHSGYLITFPDNLIPATMVADSINCMRRAVLSSRTTASIEDNKPSASLICGSAVHEIVEKAFIAPNYSSSFLLDQIPEQIKKHLVDIYCADAEPEAISSQIKDILQGFPKWAQAHIGDPPATCLDGLSTLGQPEEVTILQVVKVEENIWSHAFGLKGKIDATVIMKCPEDGRLLIAPFELKTGHGITSITHRAQTLLYSLMLWDRYRVPVHDSLLFYISKGNLFRLRPSRVDLRSLLITRNILAGALEMGTQNLPPIIGNKHLCKKCFQLESCTLFHKIAENGKRKSAPAPEFFESRTLHHRPQDSGLYTNFFKKWDRLVLLEEQEAHSNKKELWSMTARERELCGKCIGNLWIQSCVEIEDPSTFTGYECVFFRKDTKFKDILQQSQFSAGDPVVISAFEDSLFGLAIGFVKEIKDEYISVIIDRPIDDKKDIFGRLIQTFRVDKDELTSSFGLLRNNLLKVFSPENERLLQLAVNLTPPVFDFLNEPLAIPKSLLGAYSKLDACQQEVAKRALAAKDYLLVLGMPGTGKSTTFAFIIKLLVALGKSVLLASHTHSAVDNILLKLANDWDQNLVRLGNPEKIPSLLHKYVLEAQKFETLGQLETFYMRAPLIACTCLSINNPLLTKRRFDVCIIDEASQISVPSCLGPLRLAKSFVLVGDHYQLPPLVRSKIAVSEGLNQSLFSILADAQPEAIAMLRLQYRMNEDIMAISNRFVYQNMLACGNEQIAKSRMTLPRAHLFSCSLCQTNCRQGACWIQAVLDPNRTVLFLNTDNLGPEGFETVVGNSFQNKCEAQIVHLILDVMLEAGSSSPHLTVITPYRPQLKLLRANGCFKGVEMSTVDRFQGRDSSCVIISMVRSNPEGSIGELLKDWNRLNVAFTRAKSKLILIGSPTTLAGQSEQTFLKELCRMFAERSWLYPLPADCLMHKSCRQPIAAN